MDDEEGRLYEDEFLDEIEDDEPPPPLPSGEEKELLFLIEFLVDTLVIFPENMNIENMDPCTLQGQNCVEMVFLHFPPMNICEKDLDPSKLTGQNVTTFNCGKSLIFALTENQFEEPPPVFLELTAQKQLPHGCKPGSILIGRTKIGLCELFRLVFDKYDERPDQLPLSKSIKDTYELIGEKKKPAGEISVYIRLTCLGQNVVTEFKKGEDECEPFLFKNKESPKVYECKATEIAEDQLARPCPGWGDSFTGGRGRLCGEDESRIRSSDPDDENFEEIVAEINGNALKVKVEKSKRKVKPKPFHVSDFCDCDIPLPEALVEGVGGETDASQTEMAKSSLPSATACNLGRSIRGAEGEVPDGGVGLNRANQVVFQVPPEDKLARPGGLNAVSYNINTCADGEKHGHAGRSCFKVIPDASAVENPPTLPNDPEKDVFVFRIIKRGKTECGKGTLELEFKTPKEKIVAPPKPPYMVERPAGPDPVKKGKGKK